jgi:type I restriction enzyme M protein
MRNANFAWVQHIIHHLAPHGMAGFVLANGSRFSNPSSEGEMSSQIPARLRFLARDKKNGRCPDRRGQMLFIDARKLGRAARGRCGRYTGSLCR